jgi:hypothetical protein
MKRTPYVVPDVKQLAQQTTVHIAQKNDQFVLEH